MASTSSTPSLSARKIKYDVFLSFRGVDTRKTIVDHLYKELQQKGIRTFKDDEELYKGQHSEKLLQIIKESQFAIVVFSERYASSKWCLEEIATIMECQEQYGEEIVIPIFYDVEPSDVRNQRNSFAESFKRHEENNTEKSEVERWRDALKKASKISGYHLEYDFNGYEAKCVKKVVDNLFARLNPGLGVFKEVNDVPAGSLKRSIKNWRRGKVLGSGSFGTVYEGITDDGRFFAVKEVSLIPADQERIDQLQQEISLLSKFEHENIVRYLGTDKDDSNLYVFLELVSKGSLMSLYRNYRLHDTQVSTYTKQILSGLHYLHSHNVIHRDIKCANILVDVSGSVKLADFGLAKVTKLNDIKSTKGTLLWMAPEVINRKKYGGYGLAADIWSLGCTVLEMLTGQIPHSEIEFEGVLAVLYQIGGGKLPSIPEDLSEDAKDFIRKCLQVNPSDRPTALDLLQHPYLRTPPSHMPSTSRS